MLPMKLPSEIEVRSEIAKRRQEIKTLQEIARLLARHRRNAPRCDLAADQDRKEAVSG